MDKSSEDYGQTEPASATGPGAISQIMLAEYSALRTEVERRASVQWNVFALQITTAGAIASIAISAASNLALLLLVPLSSYMLGSRYILHDFHIKLIQQYIRESLSQRLQGNLQWEDWKKASFSDLHDRSWFRITGWNIRHPTRLAFEGVAILSLVAAAVSTLYRGWTTPWHWLPTLGLAAAWALGALVTFLLHRSFEQAGKAAPTAARSGPNR